MLGTVNFLMNIFYKPIQVTHNTAIEFTIQIAHVKTKMTLQTKYLTHSNKCIYNKVTEQVNSLKYLHYYITYEN